MIFPVSRQELQAYDPEAELRDQADAYGLELIEATLDNLRNEFVRTLPETAAEKRFIWNEFRTISPLISSEISYAKYFNSAEFSLRRMTTLLDMVRSQFIDCSIGFDSTYRSLIIDWS